MAPPTPIPPEQVAAVHDPLPFAAVQSFTLTRPDYLKVLILVLVVLITVSGLLPLFTRSINELVLGTRHCSAEPVQTCMSALSATTKEGCQACELMQRARVWGAPAPGGG